MQFAACAESERTVNSNACNGGSGSVVQRSVVSATPADGQRINPGRLKSICLKNKARGAACGNVKGLRRSYSAHATELAAAAARDAAPNRRPAAAVTRDSDAGVKQEEEDLEQGGAEAGPRIKGRG